MVRAVVFDFDGLIVDTETPVYQAWAEVYERYGQRLEPAFWATVIGRGQTYFDPLEDLEQRLGCRLEREAVMAAKRERERQLVAAQPVLPGVREWLREARSAGLRLGVASSSGRAWVSGHLDRLGLQDWDCLVCREDAELPKPAPDLYLAALGCLGVEPLAAVAVEDSQHGVAAAKAAGLFCVAVPCPLTSAHDLSRADLVLGSLADLPLSRVLELAARAGSSHTSQKASS